MKIVLGGGCFWCLEAIFQKINGIKKVVNGYSGGKRPNPNYDMICTGVSGYAEVVEVEFDENVITFDKILDIFFEIHDPTQLNRQGNDVGSQYRSVVFYNNDYQKNLVLQKIENLKQKGINVVTEVTPLNKFYPAEDYHQNYYNQNPQNPYCSYVIKPKIEKFFKEIK